MTSRGRMRGTALVLVLLAGTWLLAGPSEAGQGMQAVADVAPAQQEAFAAAFREAARTGNPAPLEPLLMTAGMSRADVAWNQQALRPMLAALGTNPRALRFVWLPPGSGLLPDSRFARSCTPAVILRVEATGQPGNAAVLPLCLEDGQLKRAGVIRPPHP